MKGPLSIVIPSYNRPQELERSICLIRKHFCFDYEMIVIAQGTSVSANFQGALVLKEKPGTPISRICLGVSAAKGEMILLMDDDIAANDTAKNIPELFPLLEHKSTGAIQLLANKISKNPLTRINIGWTGGGILFRKDSFLEWGEMMDTTEIFHSDVQIFLLSYLFGYQNYRFGKTSFRHISRCIARKKKGGLPQLSRDLCLPLLDSTKFKERFGEYIVGLSRVTEAGRLLHRKNLK